jgi:hypothetical protein
MWKQRWTRFPVHGMRRTQRVDEQKLRPASVLLQEQEPSHDGVRVLLSALSASACWREQLHWYRCERIHLRVSACRGLVGECSGSGPVNLR